LGRPPLAAVLSTEDEEEGLHNSLSLLYLYGIYCIQQENNDEALKRSSI
jgi:hypothetical protein